MTRLIRRTNWLVVLVLAGLCGAATPNAPGRAASPAVPQVGHLKMALVNIKVLYSDGPNAERNLANIQANLQRHLWFIDKVAAEKVDFVGFPELSLSGYHFSPNMTWLRLDGPEIKALQQKAIEKGIYISVGFAEQDANGKRWNTQIIINPKGEIIGIHRKIYLTSEVGYTQAGFEHNVFDVKGVKVGIAICADGTNKKNLQALVKNGAQVIYAPHASTGNGTIAGFYNFRAPWAGANGWIAELKVYAALHNHAGHYNAAFAPPTGATTSTGWASGAWVIGPNGQTLAQMPTSTQPTDSTEYILICDIPVRAR
jgi:predicted amidohydrolase